MKRWLSLWLPVILWCGLIYRLSSIPYLRVTPSWWDYPIRKMAHMGEYGILAGLFVRALTGSLSGSRKKFRIIALALALVYAASDEYHQTFVAGRHGTPKDLIFDAVGAVTVVVCLP